MERRIAAKSNKSFNVAQYKVDINIPYLIDDASGFAKYIPNINQFIV